MQTEWSLLYFKNIQYTKVCIVCNLIHMFNDIKSKSKKEIL